ncbi:nitrilase-related carbon-nitrogen hydrolase [Pseudarthrobacter sp. J64]|uniref:nitrilase-related carbon-nitrogen hydrolase n=1 Tax=Pseudarthrobacter sp. J64 TaxID=3116485 RepID=UPI002E81637B|nr:nitrilase-related carbon-nitrogen hydrolase [Pseudarthrobacter sp. J64]MEE2569873.1 nitrilase-related carbon-nitrogen hydrolase [Pseudarthrobacter sp. J64]
MIEISCLDAPASPARTTPSTRPALRVGVVQHRWYADTAVLHAELTEGIERAAKLGATVVFLPELTLSRYPADTRPENDVSRPWADRPRPSDIAEDLLAGPTFAFAAEAARQYDVSVHASLYQKADNPDGSDDGLGLNTAILVSPEGELVARTHKLHIPVTAGYYEDKFFRKGPAAPDAYEVHAPAELGGARLGMPTCWDEWFPEVARLYSLGGAEIIVYPTAIGSEPDHPEFDTQPLWQQVIVGNGIANGLFMIAPNRWGNEGTLNFYGSSFISDPYGRILVQAPRDESAVLVADLDLDQRRDWLTLFPFLATRRPDTYGRLTDPVDPDQPLGGETPASVTAEVAP